MNAGKTSRHKLGDIVEVTCTTTSGRVVGRVDKIHWGPDPVWLSLIEVDTGE